MVSTPVRVQLEPLDQAAQPASPQVDAGRRDRKKQATRQALRNAALRLVAERGFAHVTVEDIAEEADVATRTFFNYFPSKESAVIGSDPARIEQIRLSLLARPADEPPLLALQIVLVEFARAIEEEFEDLGESREAWFRRLGAVREDPELLSAYCAHLANVERSLSEAIAERLGVDRATDAYPSLVTAAALAATRVAGLYWSASGGQESLAKLTESAISCLGQGLTQDQSRMRTPQPPGKKTGRVRPIDNISRQPETRR